MADDRYRPDYPHGRPEDHQPPRSPRGQGQRPQGYPQQQQQHYPPPPGEGERRPSVSTPTPTSTLPPLSESHQHPPAPYNFSGLPPPGGHGYHPSDPRYASPQTMNGYPPPHGQAYQQPPPPPNGYEARPGAYPSPSDPYAGSRPPAAYPPDYRPQQPGLPPPPHQGQQPQHGAPQPPYPPQASQQPQTEYVFRQSALQPLVTYPPYGYGGQPQHGYPVEYSAQGPTMPQAAPRQRTSIACKYCRKRKIRCSGYQSAPGGKCQNCSRMNQECVFQPVSSSSSTAFIPVSAVPGGVPPGTPLFGAYGQPLAPQPHAYPPPPGQAPSPAAPGPSYHHYQPPVAHGPPQQHPSTSQHPPSPPRYAQQPPAGQAPHSPIRSSASPTSRDDLSSRDGTGADRKARRRRRSVEDQGENRLPPPRVGGADDGTRRRSPADNSNSSSPSNSTFPSYSRHSPHNASVNAFSPSTTASFSGQSSGPLPGIPGRSPVVANGSNGAMPPMYSQPNGQSTTQPGRIASPVGPAPSPGGAPQQSSSSVMSLSNLVEKNDIDRGMINRLNRPREPRS